ncbi:MAG TPA: argininosuccinate synthase [Candidatus Thermoplasmatota archaeon]|nr:argininosuccinate synthase [Candidatus Thermoplasmatota archaeon]
MKARTNGTKRIVLAYSGGLDTSVAIRWLQETKGYEVVTLTIDLGQPLDGLQDALTRAQAIGAVKTEVVDAKAEFANDYLAPALKANLLYQGVYPLATALGRPLIAKHLVQVANAVGAEAIAHGCTAKGNDQVRFDVATKTLDPTLEVVAPMREWLYTREEAVAWARERNVPLPDISRKKTYSTDENLWGRSVESGDIEDISLPANEAAFLWTADPRTAPNEPERVTIGFEKGLPVSLNGAKLPFVEIIQKLHALAGRHGVGRIDHVEDRLVGIKSHEIYEAPAAAVLLKAHRDLEAVTLTKDVLLFKPQLEQKLAELTYNGHWFSPLADALRAFVDATQETVTGEVTLSLYKGNVTSAGRASPYSLYKTDLATYGRGDAFNHAAATGFIELWGLPLQVAAAVKQKAAKTLPESAHEEGLVRKVRR